VRLGERVFEIVDVALHYRASDVGERPEAHRKLGASHAVLRQQVVG
jgi:hypothetical protein